MKMLTKEEANGIPTKPDGKASRVRAFILAMKPGEFLKVEPADWKWKRKTPGAMCRRLENKSSLKYDCKRALDGSGWVIERLK
jgi:hypothetical protein